MSKTTALIPPLDVQTVREDGDSPRIEVAGLQGDDDLRASRLSSPVVLRRAIADAQNLDQLREAGRGLRTTAVALQDAQAGPAQTSAIISTLADSLTRRSIELSVAALGPPPCPFSWVALGSHGRRVRRGGWGRKELHAFARLAGLRGTGPQRPCRRQARGERGRGPFRSADKRLAPADSRVHH